MQSSGMSERVFYDWMKNHPSFAAVVNRFSSATSSMGRVQMEGELRRDGLRPNVGRQEKHRYNAKRRSERQFLYFRGSNTFEFGPIFFK